MLKIWCDFWHSNVYYFVSYSFFTVIIKQLGSLPEIEFSYENDPDTTLYVYTIFRCKAFLNIIAALDVWFEPKPLISLLYIVGFVLELSNDVSFFGPCLAYYISEPKDLELVASLDLLY